MGQSKWQLPTQKGTQLWPQVTKSPTKVRFDGVPPGSALAYQLYKRLQPQISHFHRSQAQTYSLSIVDNYRAHGTYPGLVMTYTNLQGQEILDIKVAAEIIEEVLKDKKKTTLSALLTFDYPDMWGLKVYHYAFMVSPEPRGGFPNILPNGVALPGMALEDSSFGTDDGSRHPVLAFPPIVEGHARYAPPFVTEPATGGQRSTLMVDLRELANLPAITFDVYVDLVHSFYVTAQCRHTAWHADPTINPIESGNTDDVMLTFETAGGNPFNWDNRYYNHGWVWPSDFFIPPTYAAPTYESVPNLVLPEFSFSYDVYAPPQLGGLQLPGDFLVEDTPAGFSGTQRFDTESWYTNYTGTDVVHDTPSGAGPDNPYIYEIREIRRQRGYSVSRWEPIYQWVGGGDIERVCTIRGLMLDGGTSLAISNTYGLQTFNGGNCDDYILDQSFYSWEIPSLYPQHPGGSRLGEATVSSAPEPLTSGRYGKFLCRVTVLPELKGISISTRRPA